MLLIHVCQLWTITLPSISADWTSSFQQNSVTFGFFCGLQQTPSLRGCAETQLRSTSTDVHGLGLRVGGGWKLELPPNLVRKTAMCSSLFQLSFSAEIVEYSTSFEAHQPGSAKITEHAHHEAKNSLQRCRSATFVKSVWDLGLSEDQDVWKNHENYHSKFSKTGSGRLWSGLRFSLQGWGMIVRLLRGIRSVPKDQFNL